MNGTTARWMFFCVALGLVALGTLPFAATETIADAGLPRVFGFLAMAVGCAVAPCCFPPQDRWKNAPALALLVGAFVLPRLLLWPAAVSDDVHRYRWEGRLILHGQNPLAAPADDPVFAPWRDGDWAQMNHRDRGTIYPPVAQLVFAGMAAAEEWIPRRWLEKGVFLTCDLLIFGLVLLLLRRRHLPPSRALLYALHPVVLVSFAAEAHYDALFVLPLVAAIYALETNRPRGSWALLAVSIQVKLISAVLAPLWLLRGVWRGAWIGVLVILLSWLPFADALPAWTGALFEFGGNSAFLGLLPWLFRGAGLAANWAAPVGALLFLLSLGWILRVGGSPATVARRSLAALLLCSPILHFWYLVWLLPFWALRPSLAWGWLGGAQALYFLVWETQAATGVWALPAWVEPVIWIPFLVLATGEGIRLLRRGRERGPRSAAPTLGIVIPAYAVEDSLAACLASIRRGSAAPERIVVVDGGSRDGTVALAREHGVEVITAPLGRGSQIEAGIQMLDTDWVLILHADCLLHPQAVETIRALGEEVAGGGLGQRFHESAAVLTLIECVNEGRALFEESYWGDQGQFLRRSHSQAWSGLRDFPLMEDVELSRRLRRLGETRYLGLETQAGTRQWQPHHRLRRIVLVFRTVIIFRLASYLGRGRTVARTLYGHYYGRPLP